MNDAIYTGIVLVGITFIIWMAGAAILDLIDYLSTIFKSWFKRGRF